MAAAAGLQGRLGRKAARLPERRRAGAQVLPGEGGDPARDTVVYYDDQDRALPATVFSHASAGSRWVYYAWRV